MKTVAALGYLLLLVAGLAHADDDKTRNYEVTITNLTAGQPFTPPVLLTHSNQTGIFTLGGAASPEIQAIAENGDNGPLLTLLAVDLQVHDVIAGSAPIVPAHDPGGTGFASSATFTIAARGKSKFLSFASMLICTNDGFTGLDTIKLPKRKHTVTVFSVAYEARTETNTEDFVDIVPPCQGLIGVSSADEGTGMSNPALAEDGVVIPHAGIVGGVDLVPAVHGWHDPVAKIMIKRVDHDDDD